MKGVSALCCSFPQLVRAKHNNSVLAHSNHLLQHLKWVIDMFDNVMTDDLFEAIGLEWQAHHVAKHEVWSLNFRPENVFASCPVSYVTLKHVTVDIASMESSASYIQFHVMFSFV